MLQLGPTQSLALLLVSHMLTRRAVPASARSPVHALNPPGPRLTHVCASPPAELSDEQLKEWHAQASRPSGAMARCGDCEARGAANGAAFAALAAAVRDE